MKYKVLVTGGAGFIGSSIVDRLVENGHDVRVLDNLEPQVHITNKIPEYLNKDIEFIKGDVKDLKCLKKALDGIEIIFHEAAMVGVGQSMRQVKKYVDTNILGTANLLDLLVNMKNDVKKVIVAASMSGYGEGSYECENCGIVNPLLRTVEQMKAGKWEVYCPSCNTILIPLPTKETKQQEANSIYAITKKNQEEMVLNIGKAYGIKSVALRYFNVFGPRQSLNNPYTGLAAIFQSRVKNNNPPLIFEDGNQSRDFIYVTDIVKANLLAMTESAANYEVFNVGTGKPTTVKEVAETIIKLYGKAIKPKITFQFRQGDIRHCFADISKIKEKLDFKPLINFEEGMKLLNTWSQSVEAKDKVEKATKELKKKSLI